MTHFAYVSIILANSGWVFPRCQHSYIYAMRPLFADDSFSADISIYNFLPTSAYFCLGYTAFVRGVDGAGDAWGVA